MSTDPTSPTYDPGDVGPDYAARFANEFSTGPTGEPTVDGRPLTIDELARVEVRPDGLYLGERPEVTFRLGDDREPNGAAGRFQVLRDGSPIGWIHPRGRGPGVQDYRPSWGIQFADGEWSDEDDRDHPAEAVEVLLVAVSGPLVTPGSELPEWAMVEPGIADHTLHVTGFDSNFQYQLRCTGGPGSPCWTTTNTETDEYEPYGKCLVAEWVEEAEIEDLTEKLAGPPPWDIDVIRFDDDGPRLSQRFK